MRQPQAFWVKVLPELAAGGRFVRDDFLAQQRTFRQYRECLRWGLEFGRREARGAGRSVRRTIQESPGTDPSARPRLNTSRTLPGSRLPAALSPLQGRMPGFDEPAPLGSDGAHH